MYDNRKYNVNSFIGIVVLITVWHLEQILSAKTRLKRKLDTMTSWLCKLHVTSPAATSLFMF